MRSDLLEQRRSNPDTRLLRTATKYRDDFKPLYSAYYDLRLIYNDLIGRKIKHMDHDQMIGEKTCTIVEVYPKMVRTQYRCGYKNKHTINICFSIADLVCKGVIDCTPGYCRIKEETYNG